MIITSKPLWKLVDDKNMTGKDIRHGTGLSVTVIPNLFKNGNITNNVLTRICQALNCDIADICEVVSNEQEIAQ
ncbi:helix-turn-helix transcriptional regulator [Stomatohabitans albus]|uniref:helix-turn-helix domain-containing protein n=1 Tax=Stomatohabitans albus TaxID=3110766 RepID=UPI00300D0745